MTRLIDSDDLIVERRAVPAQHRLSLLKDIWVEWGTKEDWTALQELHYKGHSLGAGARFMRCVLDRPDGTKELIGVMVFVNPQPLSGGRNDVFPHLRPNANGRDNKLINQARMLWVNTNMTWNNRTVLDTMYRSAGIAYRFKNLAYRMYAGRYNLRFVESKSSMGRFNPFSSKSGMRFTKPKPAAALEAGLKFLQGHFAASPHDIVAIREELAAKNDVERAYYERKVREFYYKWSSMEKSGDKRDLGMTRVNELSMDYVLKQTMQLIFSATIYWLWQCPDMEIDPTPADGQVTALDADGNEITMSAAAYRKQMGLRGAKFDGMRCKRLPDRMPLAAFDAQGPTEPLRWALGGPVSPSQPFLVGSGDREHFIPRAQAQKLGLT